MTIDIDEVFQRAYKQAFLRALEQMFNIKAEELCERALSEGSPLSQRIEDAIERALQHFLDEGICWERKKRCFKK